MNDSFENRFSEVQADMVSICLEYAERIADKVFIYASCEGDIISSNFFYQVNGQLKKKHKLNDDTDRHCDTSVKRQQAVLKILNDDIEQIKILCARVNRPMPTEMKLVFDVKTSDLSAKYQYQPIYTNSKDKTALTISEEWFVRVVAESTGGV